MPGENIGLLSLRGIEMIVGMIGILKAGCAYVPFNTDYPAERLKFIIEDTNIKYIVTTDNELTGSRGLEIFDCIDIKDSNSSSTLSPKIETDIDSCIYVMFTSGTTGRPKGIAVSHRNVIKLVYDKGEIAVKESDRVLQWSNYSFDGSTYDIYSSLLTGASLYMIRDDWASNADELTRTIEEKKITVCFITTALFNAFVDVQLNALKGLRKILFGGEMVSLSHVSKALTVLGEGKIVHVYGPTETTVYATGYPIYEINKDGSIPIGKPLSNTQLFVLDENRKPVPIGVAGELFIGGDGVSLGYVNNEELTKERFVENPFAENKETNKSKKHSDKLYKTGDIVRWLPEGVIEYLGRIDDQVKIRGFRIELAEIESVLLENPTVKQVTVIAKDDKQGATKKLVCYIVTKEKFNKAEIISYLKSKLPDYMVPAIWVEMESMPLNTSGKIDKKLLPEPDIADLLSNEYVAPRNETEEKLAKIWCELLGLEIVGVYDNFFELGGDSIITIQAVSRARRFGYELKPKDIFIHQTIAGLSEAVAERAASVVTGEQGILKGESGLLPIQQWYFESAEKNVSHFNQSVLLSIDKNISRRRYKFGCFANNVSSRCIEI
jgi:amino acid adenylation domain-containing protein